MPTKIHQDGSHAGGDGSGPIGHGRCDVVGQAGHDDDGGSGTNGAKGVRQDIKARCRKDLSVRQPRAVTNIEIVHIVADVGVADDREELGHGPSFRPQPPIRILFPQEPLNTGWIFPDIGQFNRKDDLPI